jgi:hypothetical protein
MWRQLKWALRYPILQGLSSPSSGNVALTQPLYPLALHTLVGAVAEHAHEVPTLCHPCGVFPASAVAKWLCNLYAIDQSIWSAPSYICARVRYRAASNIT